MWHTYDLKSVDRPSLLTQRPIVALESLGTIYIGPWWQKTRCSDSGFTVQNKMVSALFGLLIWGSTVVGLWLQVPAQEGQTGL